MRRLFKKTWKYPTAGIVAFVLVVILMAAFVPVDVTITQGGFLSVGSNVALAVNNPPIGDEAVSQSYQIGDKEWANTWTEVEYLGENRFGATIHSGHRVFFDESDNNTPKKHKLTDNNSDYVVIQSAQVCVEVYPFYAIYYDVQHEEVRLEEERWVVQRLKDDKWRDVDAYDPVITVEEYDEPAGYVIKVTVTYDTDYGILIVEYFQRDGNALKHNVYFYNTSGSTETFRVLQRWSGIAGAKVNDKDVPIVTDESYFAFHDADKPSKEFNISENLWSMVYNPDGTEKTDQCLQTPITIETSAGGLKADFIYGNWTLADSEVLEIDPATATLNNPNEDGWVIGPATRSSDGDFLRVGSFFMTQERGYVEWDISSLAGVALDANPIFRYHGKVSTATDEEINPLTEEAPSEASDANLFSYITTGTAYVEPWAFEVGETKQIDLGVSARTALQIAITAEQAWFAIGLHAPGDEGGFGTYLEIYCEEYGSANPKPTLYVEYTIRPAFVRVTEGSIVNTSLTLNIEVSAGTNRVLVVGLAYKSSSVVAPTSIFFNTDEAFALEKTAIDGVDAQCFLYYLIAPTVTTADVVITMPGSVRMVGYVAYFAGVDQSNPFTAATSEAQGTNDSPTVDVNSSADEIVVDILAQVSAGPDTAAGAHTEICDGAATGGGTDTRGAGQYAEGQATRTMNYTMSGTDNWNIIAGALQIPSVAPAITNAPASKGFGILEVNTYSDTAINFFTIENTGAGAVDIVVYATDLAGGDDTWDLSDTATPGENIYGLKAGLDDDDDTFDVVVRETEAYNELVNNLLESATQDWGLRLYMPTTVTNYDGQQMASTLTLVCSAH